MEFPPLALHYQCALFTYDFKHQPSTADFFFLFFLSSCGFMQFMGVQTGDVAGGLFGEEDVALRLSIAFLSSLFSRISDLYCALSPRNLAAAAASLRSLCLSPSLLLCICISLFAQRVAWELKTSSAGAASSCSLCLSFSISSEDHIHTSTHTFSSTKVSLMPVSNRFSFFIYLFLYIDRFIFLVCSVFASVHVCVCVSYIHSRDH